MIRILHVDGEGPARVDVAVEELPKLLHEPRGFLWVDLVGEPPESARAILGEVCGFHPLAVDDALDESHFPKVDDWDSYVYLAVHAPVPVVDADGSTPTLELDVFLGQAYLVTYQQHRIDAVDAFWRSLLRESRICRRGAAHVLYSLVDSMIIDMMRTIDILDDQIEELEDQVMAHPTAEHVERITALRRQLLGLRRILAPEREVINRLARGDFAVVPTETRIYYRDAYDHLVRLYDTVESMRDMVGGALEIYLSVVNNRMNDVMKTLTVITTLFMPLSFLAGFFGMNYFQPSVGLAAWTSQASLIVTLLVMVLSPVAMVLWMRRRDWM